jgi:hypothetical protein
VQERGAAAWIPNAAPVPATNVSNKINGMRNVGQAARPMDGLVLSCRQVQVEDAQTTRYLRPGLLVAYTAVTITTIMVDKHIVLTLS